VFRNALQTSVVFLTIILPMIRLDLLTAYGYLYYLATA
jgi:hypothetical protein